VVAVRFCRITHFISYLKIDDTTKIANLFIREIIRLHKFLQALFLIVMLSFLVVFGRFCGVS
jgi:hypothetical protein